MYKALDTVPFLANGMLLGVDRQAGSHTDRQTYRETDR